MDGVDEHSTRTVYPLGVGALLAARCGAPARRLAHHPQAAVSGAALRRS